MSTTEFRKFIESRKNEKPPKPIGYYKLNNGYVVLFYSKKPNFIHRIFTKILMGWTWEDAKKVNPYKSIVWTSQYEQRPSPRPYINCAVCGGNH